MRLATVLIAALAAWLMTACDEVNRDAFGGLLGTVGYPPIAHCDVEIYNAFRFEGLDSQAGLIVRTRTNTVGRFAVEFGSWTLGQPLIVVARPGPDARYLDYDGTTAPELAFTDREPWVAVLNEWLGGEDTITVNPMTTIAFHALMRLPTAEVGAGLSRLDREVVNSVHAAVAANFGIRCDPAVELPAPPGGPLFVAAPPNYLENNDRATAYTLACLQLARAGRAFVATVGTGTTLDFYDALARDAHDGVLDGMVYETPEEFLAQLPTVVGREASGASRLLRWVAANPLTPLEQGHAGAARGGQFDPESAVSAALMDAATGACRPTRIDSFDVWNYPYSGNLELTIRGQGLRRSDQFVFKGHDEPGDTFVVDRESVGVDGQFMYHSDTELRLRIPDFALTTRAVPNGLRVPTGANFRRVRFVLENRPEFAQIARRVEYTMTDDARVTNRVEPLLVHAEVLRTDAAGSRRASSANNLYDAATDPALLDPAADDRYVLRVRVVNPGPDAIQGMSLDLAATTATRLSAPVVLDTFSGTAADRALILPDAPAATDLAAGQAASLDYPFVFLEGAIAPGAPVLWRPVLAGVSQGAGTPVVSTNDVPDFTRAVSVAPLDRDATATLDAVSLAASAVITAGDEFTLEVTVTAAPRAGTAMRDLNLRDIELVMTLDGETTTVTLADAFYPGPGRSGLVLRGLSRNGGLAFPLRLDAASPTATLQLLVQTSPLRSGALQVTARARGADAASTTPSEAVAADSWTINP